MTVSATSTTSRVELRAGALAEAAHRFRMAEPLAVRAVGRHRVVGVADEDDAGLERDALVAEPVRIATAVPPLVAVADDRADFLETVDRRDDPLSELRMRLHDRALLGGEPPGLREDLARDADLADVVQQRTELEPLQLALAEAELATDAQGEVGDPAGV